MDQKDFLDKQFRERFRDFSAEPPATAWHAIEKGIQPAARRRLIPVWWRAAAALAALVTAGLSFLLIPRQENQLALQRMQEQPQETYQQQVADQGPRLVALAGLPASAPEENPRGPEKRVPPQPQAEQHTRFAGQLMDLLSSQPAHISPSAPAPLFAYHRPAGHLMGNAESASDYIAMNEEGSDYPRVSLGAHVISQYSYRESFSRGNFGTSGIPFENLEEPLLSLGYGLSVTIGFSETWGLQTGLSYRNMGQYLSDIMAFSSVDGMPLFEPLGRHAFNHPQTIITSQGSIRLNESSLYFADAQSFRVLTNKQAMADQDPLLLSQREKGLTQFSSFVEIPLMVRVKLFERTVALHLKGGVSGTYLLRNGVYLGRDTQQQPIGETFGLRTMNFSAMGGLMLSLPLSNRLTLHLEPTGQIFLLPMVKDELLTGKVLPYNFSVFSSFTYGF